ncbi:hypothetical protein OF897_21410 [Chryseobacterium formosus]|uniref:Uncharacterized protein n=1 Tax=Chryseobacterium formosus TaxID=1537363 RepID=A0ABT3XXS9_9FLAO|nr:hypothetical protein [Chryseobacterium formosus]MCX8526475.1 hypothetical protein [Chryseobacterium formosus]
MGGGGKSKEATTLPLAASTTGRWVVTDAAFILEGVEPALTFEQIVASLEGLGAGVVSTAGLTLGAVLMPTMIAEPEFDWTRSLPKSIPITTTGEPDSGNLYLYWKFIFI